ncbi:MAG: c-type cytochrome, partial [bacterium]|nr:c-type cytochrome [bacterium]
MKKTACLIATVFAVVLLGWPAAAPAQDPQLAETGEEVYATRCVICHGADGDGKGLTGIIHRAQQSGLVIPIYPRDFTAGVFKFRSTPSGYLPTDDDLMRIITYGIARSGMPSHTDLTEAERKAVIEYIKTFSRRWQQEHRYSEPIKIGNPPDNVGTSASVTRGRKVYAEMQCGKWPGFTGRGAGTSAAGRDRAGSSRGVSRLTASPRERLRHAPRPRNRPHL